MTKPFEVYEGPNITNSDAINRVRRSRLGSLTDPLKAAYLFRLRNNLIDWLLDLERAIQDGAKKDNEIKQKYQESVDLSKIFMFLNKP